MVYKVQLVGRRELFFARVACLGDLHEVEHVGDERLHDLRVLLVERARLEVVAPVGEELVEQEEDAPGVRLFDDEALEEVAG